MFMGEGIFVIGVSSEHLNVLGKFYQENLNVHHPYIYIYSDHCYIYIYIKVSKVGDCRWGWPEGSLFNSYYTEV